MELVLNSAQRHLLRTLFDRGSESASKALSMWLNQEIHLTTSEVELVELARATELLGSPELLVAACAMGLTGQLTGLILFVFEDQSGLALVDLLTQQPSGTTTSWSELEQSVAKETTNIVGCSYLNKLVEYLPSRGPQELSQTQWPANLSGDLVPTPPTFVREFAGSLLQFALMDQALTLDHVLVAHTQFCAGRQALDLNWTMLFVPSRESLHALVNSLAHVESGRLE
jgi:chemotaxis protein CheC